MSPVAIDIPGFTRLPSSASKAGSRRHVGLPVGVDVALVSMNILGVLLSGARFGELKGRALNRRRSNLHDRIKLNSYHLGQTTRLPLYNYSARPRTANLEAAGCYPPRPNEDSLAPLFLTRTQSPARSSTDSTTRRSACRAPAASPPCAQTTSSTWTRGTGRVRSSARR